MTYDNIKIKQIIMKKVQEQLLKDQTVAFNSFGGIGRHVRLKI